MRCSARHSNLLLSDADAVELCAVQMKGKIMAQHYFPALSKTSPTL